VSRVANSPTLLKRHPVAAPKAPLPHRRQTACWPPART